MASIVEGAGVAKGTFFNHYPSKEHILAEYHDRLMGRILQGFQQIPSRQSADRAILRAMSVCARTLQGELELGRAVLQVMLTSELLVHRDQVNAAEQLRWFRKRVQQGVDEGVFRDDFDEDTLLSLLAAVLSATTLGWVHARGKMSLDAELRRRTDLLLDSIRRRQK